MSAKRHHLHTDLAVPESRSICPPDPRRATLAVQSILVVTPTNSLSLCKNPKHSPKSCGEALRHRSWVRWRNILPQPRSRDKHPRSSVLTFACSTTLARDSWQQSYICSPATNLHAPATPRLSTIHRLDPRIHPALSHISDLSDITFANPSSCGKPPSSSRLFSHTLEAYLCTFQSLLTQSRI